MSEYDKGYAAGVREGRASMLADVDRLIRKRADSVGLFVGPGEVLGIINSLMDSPTPPAAAPEVKQCVWGGPALSCKCAEPDPVSAALRNNCCPACGCPLHAATVESHQASGYCKPAPVSAAPLATKHESSKPAPVSAATVEKHVAAPTPYGHLCVRCGGDASAGEISDVSPCSTPPPSDAGTEGGT